MIFLFISIVCSAYLVISFKVFEKLGINIQQAIVFNYLTCTITGYIMNGGMPSYSTLSHTPWFYYAVFLGCSYIFIFNLMAIITTTQGATVTTVANKLSMMIPVTASFFLYGDKITTVKIAGIIIALAAVVFTSLKEDDTHQLHIRSLYLPLIVFVFSGVNDSLVKYSQFNFINGNSAVNGFNITLFSSAFAIGAIVMLYHLLTGKYPFQYKAIIAGVLLGVPNYFSMYALVKLLQEPGWDSSSIFPINNIGTVSLISLTAFVVFREHLSRKNWLGLGAGITFHSTCVHFMIYSFKTIAHISSGEYKEKGSKFIASAIPVISEDEIKTELKKIKSGHPKARHHCYAYRLGYGGNQFRANDDGEPSGTAGRPILSQIDSFGLTNILVVVVRYFGGILLGASGLTKAYKLSAQDALSKAAIVEKEITEQYELDFNYSFLPEIMKLLKTLKIETDRKDIAEKCNFTVNIPHAKLDELKRKLERTEVVLKKMK